MIPLYIHRDTFVHRAPAGAKIIVSLTIGATIFFIEPLWLTGSILIGLMSLYGLARLPLASLGAACRPVLLAISIIFALQFALAGFHEALAIVLRILSAVLLASLVTLTTRFSDMLETLTRSASPLARLGLEPARLALAISLAIRFIPTLLKDLSEIRQATRARRATGLRALAAGPLIVKILRMTDAVGNAIASRGFENRK